MTDRPEWFAPRRIGIGAGKPISWQGWLMTGILLLFVVIPPAAFRGQPLLILGIITTAWTIFLIIAARTACGRSRWRRGEYD